MTNRSLHRAIDEYVRACGGNTIVTSPESEAAWAAVLREIEQAKHDARAEGQGDQES